MTIDWKAVATIVSPIIAFVLGVAWQRWSESRPPLISHWGHVASFVCHPPNGQAFTVNTHAVVLRNPTRRAVTNVRLRHHAAVPDFTIWQPLSHHIDTLPGGSQDIVIPTLVPGREIIVSYLYFPPVTYDRVNAGIECDQGFARGIPVLLQRYRPRWLINVDRLLRLIGVTTIGYLAFRAIIALMP